MYKHRARLYGGLCVCTGTRMRILGLDQDRRERSGTTVRSNVGREAASAMDGASNPSPPAIKTITARLVWAVMVLGGEDENLGSTKIAWSDLEQRSEATLTPQGRSTWMCKVTLVPQPKTKRPILCGPFCFSTSGWDENPWFRWSPVADWRLPSKELRLGRESPCASGSGG